MKKSTIELYATMLIKKYGKPISYDDPVLLKHLGMTKSELYEILNQRP